MNTPEGYTIENPLHLLSVFNTHPLEARVPQWRYRFHMKPSHFLEQELGNIVVFDPVIDQHRVLLDGHWYMGDVVYETARPNACSGIVASFAGVRPNVRSSWFSSMPTGRVWIQCPSSISAAIVLAAIHAAEQGLDLPSFRAVMGGKW